MFLVEHLPEFLPLITTQISENNHNTIIKTTGRVVISSFTKHKLDLAYSINIILTIKQSR